MADSISPVHDTNFKCIIKNQRLTNYPSDKTALVPLARENRLLSLVVLCPYH